MKKIIIILFFQIIAFCGISQRVKIGAPTFDGMLAIGGHFEDTILYVESYNNKPLVNIRRNQKITMGLKEGLGLLNLSSDASVDQLSIRNSTFNTSRMHVSNLNVTYPSKWEVNAFTWPSFPNLANFAIYHADYGNVLNMTGDGKWYIGPSPGTLNTLNVDGNIAFTGALRPAGNAGMPGQVLKYVNNVSPNEWVSPTNDEYNKYQELTLNSTITLNATSPQVVLASYPIDVSGDRTMVEFNFSNIVRGECFLCTARGYIMVSLIPDSGFPSMYGNTNHHYLYYFFDVDDNRLHSPNGVGSFDMLPIHTSGPHTLYITLVRLEGTLHTGTVNILNTSSSDYFFNFKVLK
jgi:hypothetical protein